MKITIIYKQQFVCYVYKQNIMWETCFHINNKTCLLITGWNFVDKNEQKISLQKYSHKTSMQYLLVLPQLVSIPWCKASNNNSSNSSSNLTSSLFASIKNLWLKFIPLSTNCVCCKMHFCCRGVLKQILTITRIDTNARNGSALN